MLRPLRAEKDHSRPTTTSVRTHPSRRDTSRCRDVSRAGQPGRSKHAHAVLRGRWLFLGLSAHPGCDGRHQHPLRAARFFCCGVVAQARQIGDSTSPAGCLIRQPGRLARLVGP
jgi:hypothetical protein